MPSSTHKLIFSKGTPSAREYELLKPETRPRTRFNGRSHFSFSRRLASSCRECSVKEITYLVEDLGSSNGTFVNGTRLTGRQILKSGDEIRLGQAVTSHLRSAGSGRCREDDGSIVVGYVDQRHANHDRGGTGLICGDDLRAAAIGRYRGGWQLPHSYPDVSRSHDWSHRG